MNVGKSQKRKQKRSLTLLSFLVFLHLHRQGQASSAGEFPLYIYTKPETSNGSSSSDDDELETSSDFEDVSVVIQWSDDGGNGDQGIVTQMTDSQTETKDLSSSFSPDVVAEQREADNSAAYRDDSSQKPLQTLQKLQQMLDETDYMTVSPKSKTGFQKPHTLPLQSNPNNNIPQRKQEEQAQELKQSTLQDQLSRRIDTPAQQQRQKLEKQEQKIMGQDRVRREEKPKVANHIFTQQQKVQQRNTETTPMEQPQRRQEKLKESLNNSNSLRKTPQRIPQTFTQAKQQRQPLQHTSPPLHVEPLWTSKDRSKYKKMQQMQRRAQDERRRLAQLRYLEELQQQTTSDDETTDATEGDTDDIIPSYTLPNLPIYMSDAEGEGSDTEPYYGSTSEQTSIRTPQTFEQQRERASAAQQATSSVPPRPSYGYPPIYQPQPPLNQQQQQQYSSSSYAPYLPPPHFYNPAYNQQYTPQQQQQLMAQYAAQWSNYPRVYEQQHQQQLEAQKKERQWGNVGVPENRQQGKNEPAVTSLYSGKQSMELHEQQQPVVSYSDVPVTLAEATSQMSFDSIQKSCILFASVTMLAYCAVSPHNLPLADYNRLFYENLQILALVFVCPLIIFMLVCDVRENDVNSVMTSFYSSFTVGYTLSFGLEILCTTLIRLGVFLFWEPNIFKLSPKVPIPILPWVVREVKYRPKRITLFVADFLTSCIASPIIEEYIKLLMLHWSVQLPRNFQWYIKTTTKKKKKKRRRVAEAARQPNEPEVTNINSYVTHMLAVSLGMKLCDAIRRILMYTKASQHDKSFYAFFRGLFPIHELCGTMTVLGLAKRNVLGVDMPLWKILFPAVFIHGLANFRGMKPIFKWNSAAPWSEMQLSPWNVADDSTLPQLLNKGFAKIMWIIIQARVLGYCVKNYYLISRQARKRTTTYAGKQAAFSAELAA
eukprot:CAMPEP_0194217836 /NCGR_PEP_ID=MMETSP0156-20130528/22354_1 /TAXON_ID=33649 /ORGANISM="Thalassionema nitzschioides, Strain L26-B" /LENGTH=935 /DNA_ID=CAMNT_0038946981 /DNA_START=15 /DNA_END=2819 /DNA_ORIENTATION=+